MRDHDGVTIDHGSGSRVEISGDAAIAIACQQSIGGYGQRRITVDANGNKIGGGMFGPASTGASLPPPKPVPSLLAFANTKIISLVGGPGSGKSTLAAGLFYQMKQRKVKCELIFEYAKELTYGKSPLILNQLHVFTEQYRRQLEKVGEVDFVISDSSLILSCLYHEMHVAAGLTKLGTPMYHGLTQRYFFDTFAQFDNKTYFVSRNKEYQKYGRSQTEDEAKAIDVKARLFMDANYIPYDEVTSDDAGITKILNDLGIDDPSRA